MTEPDDLIRGNAEAARLTGRDPRNHAETVEVGTPEARAKSA